ncbi:MAG TPA: GNAT family N-acetyltransferase [Nitrospiraceae bacterium]|nr:GNAT family N-acetyltransferase [Nitrospiraceae bacterium]
MPIRIQRAQPADAPVIAELVGELLQEIMAAIGANVFAFDRAGTESRANTWLEEQIYTVLLAYEEGSGSVAGFLAMYESRALYAGGPFGTIPELYVRPAFRSQGAGTSLVKEAKRYAESRGWTRLEVTTPPLPQFERTLAFYERHKFSISGGRKMKADL